MPPLLSMGPLWHCEDWGQGMKPKLKALTALLQFIPTIPEEGFHIGKWKSCIFAKALEAGITPRGLAFSVGEFKEPRWNVEEASGFAYGFAALSKAYGITITQAVGIFGALTKDVAYDRLRALIEDNYP